MTHDLEKPAIQLGETAKDLFDSCLTVDAIIEKLGRISAGETVALLRDLRKEINATAHFCQDSARELSKQIEKEGK